jgi:hypothetical protein
VSLVVLGLVYARSVLVSVQTLVMECSCGYGGLSRSCPPPSRLPDVAFCWMNGIFGWVEGLLLCCVEFELVGSVFVRPRGGGEGMGCDRTHCGSLVSWWVVSGVGGGGRMVWVLKRVY